MAATAYLTNWTKAIYLDDGVSNTLVRGNVCRSCGQFAWQIHGGDHNTIVNNIFDLSSPGAMVGIYQVTQTGETTVWQEMLSKGISSIFLRRCRRRYIKWRSMEAMRYLINRNNLYWSSTGARAPNHSVIIDASPVYADPGFAQPSAGNYSLPRTSPALTLIGFRPLPNDQGPLPR